MTTAYQHARRLIRSGDLLVLRNAGIVGDVGRHPASHVGIAVWRHADQHSLSISESREFVGARTVSFSSQVRAYPGQWDVYTPVMCPAALRERAATIAYNWAGHAYDYPGCVQIWIVQNALWRRAARRLGFDPALTDVTPTPWEQAKKCSALYPWAYRWALAELREELPEARDWTWDAVPELNDRFIEPADLVRSGSFRKVCEGLVIARPQTPDPSP